MTEQEQQQQQQQQTTSEASAQRAYHARKHRPSSSIPATPALTVVSTGEASSLLGIHRTTLWQWLRRARPEIAPVQGVFDRRYWFLTRAQLAQLARQHYRVIVLSGVAGSIESEEEEEESDPVRNPSGTRMRTPAPRTLSPVEQAALEEKVAELTRRMHVLEEVGLLRKD